MSVSGVSVYNSMQAWTAKQAAFRKDLEASTATITSAFTDGITNQSSGMATLTAQKALARIQAETAAKKAKATQDAINSTTNFSKHFTTSGSSVTLSDGTVINLDSNPKLAGGSSVDLSGDILTLSNGTKIDLKTGQKKVEVLGNGIAITV